MTSRTHQVVLTAIAAIATVGITDHVHAQELLLRIVTAGEEAPGPINVPLGDSTFSQEFYVQLVIAGDPTASGLATYTGELTDDTSGSFDKAPLTNSEVGVPSPGLDLAGRAGLFPTYRILTFGNDDPSNGALNGSVWTYLPISLAPCGSGGGGGQFTNTYKFSWTTTDLTPRTVTLVAGNDFGGYQDGTCFLQQPIPVVVGTFDIIFPTAACSSADFDASGDITIIDLLGYISLWFNLDPGAERTGDDPADIAVTDLLDFLSVWFMGCD